MCIVENTGTDKSHLFSANFSFFPQFFCYSTNSFRDIAGGQKIGNRWKTRHHRDTSTLENYSKIQAYNNYFRAPGIEYWNTMRVGRQKWKCDYT